jgi:hypothetical protein
MEEPMPEPPEAPGVFGYARYVWHYIVREGSVVRRAPLSLLLALVVVGAPTYWLVSGSIKDEYARQIEDLKSANERLDDTTKSLQATIQLQDRKLLSLTAGTTTVGENQNTRLQYVTSTRLPPPLPVRINMVFANRGNAPAIGANFRGSAQVSASALLDKD